MSTVRWKTLPPVRQDRFGYYLCRLCESPCPENERQWCSEACLKRYLTLSHGTFVRAQLAERDHGVCAECGVDAAQMDAALADLKADLLHPLLMTIHPMIVTTLKAEGWTSVKCRGRGSYPDAIEFSSCWEAHHVQSVVDGGGECGLENYRTLCFVCHKKISAEQASRRAQLRRANKREAKPVPSSPRRAPVPDDEIPF